MRYLFLYSIVNENVNLFYDCSTEKFVSISSINKSKQTNIFIYTGTVILLTSVLRLFNTTNTNYSPILFFIFPIGILIGYFVQNNNFKNKYSDLTKGEKKNCDLQTEQIFNELTKRIKIETNLLIFLCILYFTLVIVYFLTSNLALLIIINLLSIFIGLILSGLNCVKKNEKSIKFKLKK